MKINISPGMKGVLVLVALLVGGSLLGQLQPSNNNVILGAGSAIIGKVGIDQTTPGTTNGVQVNAALPAGGNTIGNVGIAAGAASIGTVGLNAGTNIVGLIRMVPGACTQTTIFTNSTVGVAITTGTTVTSTTSCIISIYANNITNSSVTLRLADKAGTPVIWLGGNNDFSIPPNSNIKVPVDGIVFTSGITAIAGTGSAINLYTTALQ